MRFWFLLAFVLFVSFSFVSGLDACGDGYCDLEQEAVLSCPQDCVANGSEILVDSDVGEFVFLKSEVVEQEAGFVLHMATYRGPGEGHIHDVSVFEFADGGSVEGYLSESSLYRQTSYVVTYQGNKIYDFTGTFGKMGWTSQNLLFEVDGIDPNVVPSYLLGVYLNSYPSDVVVCDAGCLIVPDSSLVAKECLPFGMRLEGRYCSLGNALEDQKAGEMMCENNYECSTNVCVDGACISPSLIQKILAWFKALFS